MCKSLSVKYRTLDFLRFEVKKPYLCSQALRVCALTPVNDSICLIENSFISYAEHNYSHIV